MITTAHLCSGYDGLGTALRRFGEISTLWHAEIDPDMSTVLAKHEPGVLNVGDLIRITVERKWGDAPVPDILTAGFPCQPVSGAGRQLADLDPRWLWPFIIEAIRVMRPPYLLLENVLNLVSIQGGSVFRTVLDDLGAAGYAVRWTTLGACAVGAPHHRHRVFMWANRITSGPTPEARRIGTKTACGAPRAGGRLLLATPKASDTFGAGTARIADGKKPWHDLPTMVALLPTPAARDGGLRGTPSPEHAARRAADPNRSLNLEDAVSLLPTPRATVAANGGPGQRGSRGDLAMPSACQPEHWGRFAEAVALWEQITGVPAPEPTEPNTRGGRRMSPLLPEWMMGIPPGTLTDVLARNPAIKGAGNGVVPLQAAAALQLLL